MIRTCDGTDENLCRERVTRISATGQEQMDWVACDCGLTFDDAQRVTIYPHYFIPSPMERDQLIKSIDSLRKQGMTAEQIRDQLTNQRVTGYGDSNTSTTERNPMGDYSSGRDYSTGRDDQSEAVSPEGTTNTAAPVDSEDAQTVSVPVEATPDDQDAPASTTDKDDN